MRRAALTFALALAALAGPGMTALAADRSVKARDDFFSPESVTVLVGDTVKWHNSGFHTHNVVFDATGKKTGGDPVTHEPSATPWDAQFKFTKAGTFRYYCSEHGDKGGFGMSGKVVVKAPDTKPPAISSLRADPAKFCTNKSQNCSKPGTHVKFGLSEAAAVTGSVKPANTSQPFKQVFNKALKSGQKSVAFAGKDLKPGAYVLRVAARDAAGNVSKFAKTTFTVKQKG